ncbi:MAG TPA: periplasmic heavy metal sensor [Thermoanaerobaculia bacterium]|jgi:Spy/CpxP family protein refolding chaperone
MIDPMKGRRAASLLAVVAAVLLALPLAAQPPRGPHDPAEILHNPRLLARYLRLTPDQVTASQKLFADLKATLDPLHQQGQQLRDAFQAAVSAANANPCDVGQAALAVHANDVKIKAALDDFDQKFSALLTPDQLARYEALKALVHGDGGDS